MSDSPPPSPVTPTSPPTASADAAPAEAAPPPPAGADAAEPASSEAAAAPAELSPAECAAKLAQSFPALFAPVPNTPPKPIKLRIQADIQARAPGQFTRRSLSPFLHRHTTTTSYLKALVASAHRYDLDGAPAGEVSDEHRQAAQAELDRRWAIVQARRAAERSAQRAAAPEAAGTPMQGGHGANDTRVDNRVRERRQAPPGPRPPQRSPQRPPREGAPPRPDRTRRHPPEARSHGARDARSPAPADAPAALPDDPARRERALLLRAYESTTLSRANFCALKRIAPEQLDALLEQARSEARGALPGGARHG